MYHLFHDDADYEFNARFDYIREAYAATELDPLHEGYCDYLNDCDQDGEEPLDFDAWRAAHNTPRPAPAWPSYGDDEIPF